MTPEDKIKAHQYLYYVLNRPVLSDYAYDMLCKRVGVFGGGGSDNPNDYTKEQKELAYRFLTQHDDS